MIILLLVLGATNFADIMIGVPSSVFSSDIVAMYGYVDSNLIKTWGRYVCTHPLRVKH